MKRRILIIGTTGLFAISLALFMGCGNAEKDPDQHHEAAMDHDHGMGEHHDEGEEHHHAQSDNHMDATSMSVEQSASASEVLNAYLDIKNALVEDDDAKAAQAGKKLVAAFDHMDKSSVSQDQMKEVDDIIDNARENAEHISENQGNIDHQREHLAELFADIRDLVALTGSDRNLYEIYCPMANDNEGAMWLSASNEIKNPTWEVK